MSRSLITLLLAVPLGLSWTCASAQTQSTPVYLKASELDSSKLSRQEDYFPAASKLETVFTGACGVVEGMAAAPNGEIFFTEVAVSAACSDTRGVPGGRIFVFDPKSGATRVYREPSGMAAGLAFDRQGQLIVAEGADFGGRRVSRTDLATGEYRTIAYLFENRQLNAPNDVAVDPQGRVYFSDIRMFGPETIDQRISGVYRLDVPDGKAKGLWPITRMISNNSKINGVEIPADGHTLYTGLCDFGSNAINEQGAPDLPRNGAGGLMAYDLSADGSLSKPRVLLDLQSGGCVDGMTTDPQGNLYAAVNAAPSVRGIYVFSKERLVARFQLPNAETAANLAMGAGTGEDADSLYVGVVRGGKLYRLKLGTHR